MLLLTADSGYGPVPPHIRGPVSQLEGEGPGVGDQIPVESGDVDGVRLWLFAHLHFVREHFGGVVVDVQQVDLESACSTRSWFTCSDHK